MKIAWCIIPILIYAAISAGQTGKSDAEVFPMRKGTRWIYRGEVSWQGRDDKVRRKRIDWPMEVVESVQRAQYRVALILGHPRDLAWYEEGQKPDWHILIAVDNTKFYLRDCRPPACPGKLILPEGDLKPLIDEDDLILRLPLGQGDIFGGDPDRHGMYAWSVETLRPARLGQIRGIAPGGPKTEYELIYRTNPDHQVVTYVPGIGMTSYIYSHHGTVSEVSVRLMEFHGGESLVPQ